MKRTLWLVVLGALFGSVLVGQASTVLLNGLFYTWPTSHSAKALANNSAGTLTWTGDIDSGVPSGLIGFYVASASCPTGWTEYTAARGRYIVNGTSTGTTVGTALDSNAGENRTAGVHGHTSSISASITDSAHNHSVSGGNHSHGGFSKNDYNTDQTGYGSAWSETSVVVSTTGISLNSANAGISATPSLTVSAPSGAVAGTNAPYIRVLVCQKS